jgi:hypothetical protein
MKQLSRGWLCACSGGAVLACAGTTQALFISTEFQSTETLTSGQQVEVYHMYARGFDPGDVLFLVEKVSVALGSSPYQFTSIPFASQNDVTPPNSGFFSFAPDLRWDSYVTIGDADSADGTDIVDVGTLILGPTSLEGLWLDSNESTHDGEADAFGRVFLGQLTFLSGQSASLSGQALLHYSQPGSDFFISTVVSVVPTPGVSALGGALMLAWSRRRR